MSGTTKSRPSSKSPEVGESRAHANTLEAGGIPAGPGGSAAGQAITRATALEPGEIPAGTEGAIGETPARAEAPGKGRVSTPGRGDWIEATVHLFHAGDEIVSFFLSGCVDQGAAGGIEEQGSSTVETGLGETAGPSWVQPTQPDTRTRVPPECESCGKPTTVLVYFPESQGADGVLEILERQARELRRVFTNAEARLLRCRVIRREDWATNWRGAFPPERVSARFWVLPTWERPALPPEALPIVMEPGLAFGTGKHATTRQCLEFLEQIAEAEGHLPTRMLDAGCGSGILAMAACLLGVRSVFGVDLDPDAIQTARMNLSLNRLDRNVLLINGPLDCCRRGRFDLIAANLTARILREHCTLFADILAPEGRCILSGMLSHESPEVARAYEQLGFRAEAERGDPEEGWTALLLRK